MAGCRPASSHEPDLTVPSHGAEQPARELTVRVVDEAGELVAGVSGWTWGLAAGIGMTWVRAESRGAGLGSQLLASFEEEARSRGCGHVFVTSFTFQAPGFYERHGYRELFRWEDLPSPGAADVHLRKELWGCPR